MAAEVPEDSAADQEDIAEAAHHAVAVAQEQEDNKQ